MSGFNRDHEINDYVGIMIKGSALFQIAHVHNYSSLFLCGKWDSKQSVSIVQDKM